MFSILGKIILGFVTILIAMILMPVVIVLGSLLLALIYSGLQVFLTFTVLWAVGYLVYAVLFQKDY